MVGSRLVLHRALADAERLGLVARNAAHAAKAPVGRRKEMATWTAEELAAFLQFVRDDRLSAAYVLLATTGMRRGEVFGLRWSDVDLVGKRLSVAQTLTTMNDQVFLGPTKTLRSRRSVALDGDTVAALRAHRKRQNEERLAIGEGWDASHDLVFRAVDGSPLHPDRFTQAFKRRMRESGLPVLRGPHSLRHTWATLALQAGVHPKVVSDRLGQGLMVCGDQLAGGPSLRLVASARAASRDHGPNGTAGTTAVSVPSQERLASESAAAWREPCVHFRSAGSPTPPPPVSSTMGAPIAGTPDRVSRQPRAPSEYRGAARDRGRAGASPEVWGLR